MASIITPGVRPAKDDDRYVLVSHGRSAAPVAPVPAKAEKEDALLQDPLLTRALFVHRHARPFVYPPLAQTHSARARARVPPLTPPPAIAAAASRGTSSPQPPPPPSQQS
ncbi:hypothetical protein EDB87DRAFT_1681204 [Lactarius vividus]|nr:hypothetical protein EDB87DRAFT_1681204 [Lactarius vividus]